MRCDALLTPKEFEESYSQLSIQEIMAKSVISLREDCSVFKAIELMVENSISGVPVVDEESRVLGVVSGYDIICLDASPGRVDMNDRAVMFPEIGRCEQYDGDKDKMWSEFKTIKEAAEKSSAETVGEIMHDAHIVPLTYTVEQASNDFLYKKFHRLCVVDADERLVGIISRGDVMKVALKNLKEYMSESMEETDSKDSSSMDKQ